MLLMKAIVKNNNSYYASYILAISNEKDFWNTRIIVFNDTYSSIKMIALYRKEKIKLFESYNLYDEAFIFDYDDSDFIETKKWRGISSIVEDDSLIKKLEANSQVDILDVEESEKFAKKVEIPEWNEVNTEKDIKNLEMISSYFHDACIEYAIREDNNLCLSLDCMNCTIVMKFIDIIDEDIEDRVGQILNSKIEKIGNTLKWNILDGFGGWTDGVNYDINAEGAFIRCKQILWSFKHLFDNTNAQIEESAMAIVMCKGKILTINEMIYGKETLSLPKGHKEDNETLLETSIRECYEETNIVINEFCLVKKLTPYTYEFLNPSNKLIRKTIIPYLFEVTDFGNPKPKEERMKSVQWMNVEEFLLACHYENVKNIVNESLIFFRKRNSNL